MCVQPYTEQFFHQMRADASGSAGVIVPLVINWVRPRSVIDVGCGTGTWLAAFRSQGVEDVLGIDGDYVDRAMLEIPSDRFRAHDLVTPLRLGREFDLVLSLEVAEHVAAESADLFVDSLTRAGPVVLFSAAAPHQGGTHHINEQWPAYWAERFGRRGYDVIDCVRRRVWHNPEVCWYYAQNVLLFVRRDYLDRAPEPLRDLVRDDRVVRPLSVVHPHAYVEAVKAAARTRALAHELALVVAPGEPFVFVDAEAFRTVIAAGSRAIPFMERDGVYWGLPPDDDAAIAEVDRQRAGGARLIVFAWTTFWCLDYYPRLHDYLRERFPCVRSNPQLIAFDLAAPAAAAASRGGSTDAR